MPSRDQTMSDAIQIFQNRSESYNSDVSKAWLGIYQVLLWYESVNWLGFEQLPHIIDADKLRPASPAKKAKWKRPNIWQQRGQAISTYLSEQLGCSIDNLPQCTDLLMKSTSYVDLQRQNILDTAFVGLIKHVLERFGTEGVIYSNEVEATTVFPGITFPGRSSTPRIDLLAIRRDIPCAVISAKWSLRHDRLNDITNECPVYKAAYERIYRGARRDHLRYYLVTNEFDPARLNKVLNDTCVDGVVHVHKAAVVDVCGLDGRLEQLIDLTNFVTGTQTW